MLESGPHARSRGDRKPDRSVGCAGPVPQPSAGGAGPAGQRRGARRPPRRAAAEGELPPARARGPWPRPSGRHQEVGRADGAAPDRDGKGLRRVAGGARSGREPPRPRRRSAVGELPDRPRRARGARSRRARAARVRHRAAPGHAVDRHGDPLPQRRRPRRVQPGARSEHRRSTGALSRCRRAGRAFASPRRSRPSARPVRAGFTSDNRVPNMSVKKEPSGRRSVQVEVEVKGTPEQVWQAIATGPGISAWFVPTRVEGRVGGSVASDFGGGMVSSATITEWQPPHRLVAEDKWLEGGPPVASEWTVEAKQGGTCIVRVVHSLFASTDDWDGQLESTEHGWPGYFRVLRHYLERHAGEAAASFVLMAPSEQDANGTWSKFSKALGLPSPSVGQALRAEGTGSAAIEGSVQEDRKSTRLNS